MKRHNLIEGDTTSAIIGAFYDVYYELGFGFLEYVYAFALELELRDRGCHVTRETPIAIFYKGRHLTTQRADMVVNDRVIVELKSTEVLPPMLRGNSTTICVQALFKSPCCCISVHRQSSTA